MFYLHRQISADRFQIKGKLNQNKVKGVGPPQAAGIASLDFGIDSTSHGLYTGYVGPKQF